MRKEFTNKIRVAAWQRADGKCENCGRKLYPGDTHFDHRNPDGLTGEPTIENCQVLCRSCHQVKTVTQDVPSIARAKRREARHIGARQSRRPMPGSRASGLRKRMDGRVERRS